jgi:hypothetical protein
MHAPLCELGTMRVCVRCSQETSRNLAQSTGNVGQTDALKHDGKTRLVSGL